MSSPLPIPVLFVDPKLDRKIAQELGQELAAGCTWIEKVFGIAKPGYRKGQDGKISRQPEIYMNNTSKDYYVVLPDDRIKSFIFFTLDAPFSIDFDKGDEAEYELSIFCWVNLHKLDGGRNYDYTEELAMDMIRVLRESNTYSERFPHLEIDLDPSKLFQRFDLPEDYYRYMSYPYSGFRIDAKILAWDNPSCFQFVNTNIPPC